MSFIGSDGALATEERMVPPEMFLQVTTGEELSIRTERNLTRNIMAQLCCNFQKKKKKKVDNPFILL